MSSQAHPHPTLRARARDLPQGRPDVRAEHGFTLLEIVIAVALTALLISFGASSFISLSKVQSKRLEEFSRDPIAEVVLDQMEREIVGTLLLERPEGVAVADHPWIFTVESDELGGGEADTLRFVTESPARVAGAPVGGAFRIVTYRAQTANDGRLSLYRAEEVLPERAALDLPTFEDPPTVRDVAGFGVALIDDDTGARVDQWDSIELQPNRLPVRVELSLQLNSPVGDKEGALAPGRVFRRSVVLPVRPLGGDDDENCQGPSLAECLSRFEEVLSTLGDQAEQSIAALVDEVEDPRCFATVIATPQGMVLADELRQLTQLDPNEVCQ